MNLKQRFSLLFSCLFAVIMAAVMLTVYYLFANFRKEEFYGRLAEKAETTLRLLVDVKELSYDLQKVIDRNSVSRLYKEKTQVFDQQKKLIYSSNDSVNMGWTDKDLDQVKAKGRLSKKNDQYEVMGIFYTFENKDYYVLISTEDTYGNRKLAYLKYLLIYSFVISTVLIFSLSFKVSARSLKPLDDFRRQIQEITDSDLTIRLSKAKREDEINALANSFNQMMDRIDSAYNRQREFTGNASHELRTPVARITAQLENLLQTNKLDAELKRNLSCIAEDAFQLSEIISSLVALADISNRQDSITFSNIRLDEMIFTVAADLTKVYPNLRMKFEIENTTDTDTDIEIKADETLLRIVMLNLIKNAFIYSNNHIVHCLIKQMQHKLQVIITNTGEVPDIADTALLFNAFYRGSNTKSKPGSGIGLSIVRRVLQYHHAQIVYHVLDGNTNQVIVTFES